MNKTTELFNSNSNMKLAYSELAKQLKNNKQERNKNSDIINNTVELESTKHVANKSNNLSNYNEHSMVSNINIANMTAEKIKNYTTNNKTTKDSNNTGTNISSVRMNISMKKGEQMEGPEDLHFFYVNIFHNNKRLPFLFEKNSNSNEFNNDEL